MAVEEVIREQIPAFLPLRMKIGKGVHGKVLHDSFPNRAQESVIPGILFREVTQ